MRIRDEAEALDAIKKILFDEGCTEAEHSCMVLALRDYQPGIIDEIFHSDTDPYTVSPEELLRRAREKNKPILL